MLDAFAALVQATRDLETIVGSSRPTADAAEQATATLSGITALLSAYQVPETQQLSGKLRHVAGRGHSLMPPLHYEESDSDHIRGHVSFSRFYVGGGGAVHGGVLPLLFDEVFGSLAGAAHRPRSRTAYLHTNYRRITPLDRQLQLQARVEKIEGRKLFMTGTLTDGNNLLCDAEALFVTLRPGQP